MNKIIKNLNWKSVVGLLMLVAPLAQALLGLDFPTIVSLSETVVGGVLIILHRVSIGQWHWTSSTIISVVVAIVLAGLNAAGISQAEIAPTVNDILTALMGIFAALGINNAVLKEIKKDFMPSSNN